jgi:hypothetical protein
MRADVGMNWGRVVNEKIMSFSAGSGPSNEGIYKKIRKRGRGWRRRERTEMEGAVNIRQTVQ